MEFFTYTSQILAYLDPGTGSIILQVIIAGLVGGLFALKMFWRSICNFFARLFGRKKEQK